MILIVDKDKLELIRDALQLYHREFMVYFRQPHTDLSNVRRIEQKIIKLREDIDIEIQADEKRNNR